MICPSLQSRIVLPSPIWVSSVWGLKRGLAGGVCLRLSLPTVVRFLEITTALPDLPAVTIQPGSCGTRLLIFMNNLNNYWAVFKGLNLSITAGEDGALGHASSGGSSPGTSRSRETANQQTSRKRLDGATRSVSRSGHYCFSMQ